jgi:hypothetical protein
MKTFPQFIFECNKSLINTLFLLYEGKYSDEHAFRKVWNHFIVHRKYGKEIRDLISSGKYDEAREAMEKEIAASREDPKHPLSFEKAKRGFEAGKNTDLNLSQSTYYNILRLSPDGVVAYAKGRRGKSAANRPTAYAKVEGGSTPPTARMWKDVVGKESDTSKRDISIADTKNKKFGQGISLKQGEGSQTASAEPEEVRGLFQAASKKYIQQLKRNGASEEEIQQFQSDLESNISKYVRAQSLKISPKENKEKSDKRLSIAQSAVDNLAKNYPGFDRLVDKEAAGGEQKFGKEVSAQLDPESQEFRDVLTALRVRSGKIKKSDLPKDERDRVSKIQSKYKTYSQLSDLLKSSPSGQATEVVRGTYVDPKTGEVISRAKSEPVSQRGELDQEASARSGKGASTKKESGFIEFLKRLKGEEPKRVQRPGALALRVGPAKPDADKKSNQAQPQQGPITAAQFTRRARMSELQLKRAEKNLEVANIKAQNASVPIDPDTGEPIPARFRATAIQNMAADPTSRTAKINNARREKSQSIITKAQSEYDNAAASHQETQSTLDAIQQNKQPQQQTPPSEQQPQQSAATTTPSEPTQPQQQTQPPQQTPAQEQQPQQQPEPSGPKTAAQQAAELGLTGDGHGRWYDNKGNVAAETEGDILKRTAPLKPKPKNTGTAERMDAAGKKLGLPDS